MAKIPLGKPYLGKEELAAVRRVFEDGCCAGTCEEVHMFEKEFAARVGSKFAVATISCTTALQLACRCLSGEVTDLNVTVPAFTFPATAYAAVLEGHDPQFCDVDPATFNMPVHVLAETPSLAIPVHALGNPIAMNEFMEEAVNDSVLVIEDAACALGATYNGKQVGTFGDIGCFSFFAIKNLCTGEGGMLVTDREEIYEKARSLVDFGKVHGTGGTYSEFSEIGYNFRMSAIQAAIGREQLRKLDKMQALRSNICRFYNEMLPQHETSKWYPQETPDGGESSYYRYTVILADGIDRDKMIADLVGQGVQAAIGTYDMNSVKSLAPWRTETPVSQKLFRQSLSLPTYPGLTCEDMNTVVDAFHDALWRQA